MSRKGSLLTSRVRLLGLLRGKFRLTRCRGVSITFKLQSMSKWLETELSICRKSKPSRSYLLTLLRIVQLRYKRCVDP